MEEEEERRKRKKRKKKKGKKRKKKKKLYTAASTVCLRGVEMGIFIFGTHSCNPTLSAVINLVFLF